MYSGPTGRSPIGDSHRACRFTERTTMSPHIFLYTFTSTMALLTSACSTNEITGKLGQVAGAQRQSAYMDLSAPRDFKKGDHLVIRVEGTAEYVKVRLLPQNGIAQEPTGIIDGKVTVPPDGKLDVVLPEARPKVTQISLHAGREAFGEVINPNGG